jgi:hypothetical protein
MAKLIIQLPNGIERSGLTKQIKFLRRGIKRAFNTLPPFEDLEIEL